MPHRLSFPPCPVHNILQLSYIVDLLPSGEIRLSFSSLLFATFQWGFYVWAFILSPPPLVTYRNCMDGCFWCSSSGLC
ncbi:Protein of unknown function [Pyronema omphalodes CBS 100304]|uniref:Uncharacterized protein n=1 Tax=Pyronema omphalodes (strain CBS 100304) TaxID=1076935 RepID=U4L4M0_PYROM|nr:Protein of unknown function [Pyronema omphalodes CBS 100304]